MKETKIKELTEIKCLCCGSRELSKHHETSYSLIVFQCSKCKLFIHANKMCCYYKIYAMPRHTNYWVDCGDASSDCVVCGGLATIKRGNIDKSEWANSCRICNANIHVDNCGGFYEKYCPECKKYME
jgi:hypothetical protein